MSFLAPGSIDGRSYLAAADTPASQAVQFLAPPTMAGRSFFASASPPASSDATATIVGAPMIAQAGAVVASGGAQAVLPSAGVLAQAGTIAATGGGAGVAVITGVSMAASAGLIAATGSASIILPGIGMVVSAGPIAATGETSPDAVARITGVTMLASAGIILASGTRTAIGVDITEDMICAAVRRYILSIAPQGMRVIRTPVNKASTPDGPYVSFTPLGRLALSTDVSSYDGNTRNVQRADQMTFQIDCYGDGSSSLAHTLNILVRDLYALDQFEQSGVAIAPLYANDVKQMPFVNDADQYEDRYMFEMVIQVNPLVSLAQQSANILNIGIINATRA